MIDFLRCFEHCAREAAHLHGGNSYVKGNKIESLYRHVLSLAIPGGSEDLAEEANFHGGAPGQALCYRDQ